MGLLDKILRRGGGQQIEELVTAECPHASMGGRWDSVKDMGDDSKAVAFECVACHGRFSPEEAQQLRETEAERVRKALEAPGAET